MKKDIHPKYVSTKISCACGAEFDVMTTREAKVGICSKCHPFYTGKEKFVDTARRIEKFQKKYANYGQNSAETAKANKQ